MSRLGAESDMGGIRKSIGLVEADTMMAAKRSNLSRSIFHLKRFVNIVFEKPI